MIRSKLHYFVTIILPVLYYAAQAVFVLPAIRTTLGTTDLGTQLEIQIPMVLLFAIYYWGPLRKHYKKFLSLQKQRSEIMEEFHRMKFDSVIGKAHSASVRVNVMMLTRRRPCHREPKPGKPTRRKWTYSRTFRYEYISKTMRSHGGSQLKLTENQGLCGEAVRKAQPLMLDTSLEDATKFNLTPAQLDLTNDVKVVISYPIYRVKDGELLPKIIGAINIDSSSADLAQHLVNAPKRHDKFKKQCKALAELSSNLFG